MEVVALYHHRPAYCSSRTGPLITSKQSDVIPRKSVWSSRIRHLSSSMMKRLETDKDCLLIWHRFFCILSECTEQENLTNHHICCWNSNFPFSMLLLPSGHIIFSLMYETLNCLWDHFFHLLARLQICRGTIRQTSTNLYSVVTNGQWIVKRYNYLSKNMVDLI